MAHTPAPEEQPTLMPAKQGSLNLDGLKLNAGASDVTSYHDFNSLQIAFGHVWAEVFDSRLGQLGRELYETYIDLLQTTDYRTNPIKSVSSIDDILTLMGHVRELGRVVDQFDAGHQLSVRLEFPQQHHRRTSSEIRAAGNVSRRKLTRSCRASSASRPCYKRSTNCYSSRMHSRCSRRNQATSGSW